ncbi:MAG: GLPGLI family protein [Bacteroidales bacterium]
MKMTRVAIIICLLLGIINIEATAQVKRSYAMDNPSFTILNKDISKFKILDTSYLNLIYNMSFAGYLNDSTLSGNDQMCLQIGKYYTKFYSRNMHNNDSTCTQLLKTQLQVPLNESSWQGYEIYRDLKADKIIVTNRVPYTQTVSRYQEPELKTAWKLENETDTLMGYLCYKATAEVLGRSYVAWYTTDIPIELGPWKFRGLPGLIIKIYDINNEYKFECIGLSQNKQEIVEYDWKYKDVSKKTWLSFEKDMYKNAGKFVNSTGERVIIMDNSEKGFHVLPDTWQAYYNPIEK